MVAPRVAEIKKLARGGSRRRILTYLKRKESNLV